MRSKLLSAAFASLLATPSLAALMTFDNLPGEFASPFSTYTENGFTLTLTSGYATKASNGPTPPGVVNYGFNVGYNFTAAGSLFSFEGFGLNVASSNSATYSVTGYLGAAPVFTYSNTLGDTSERFPRQAPPSTASVDRVTLLFNNFGRVQGASTIDNIGATMVTGAPPTGGSGNPGSAGTVPEPATWAMMLIGFGGIGHTLRRARPARRRALSI